jgi:uncharacterized membrane protein YbhN (UPF0104 family)
MVYSAMASETPNGRRSGVTAVLGRLLNARILIPLVVSMGLLAYVSWVAAARQSSDQLWVIVQQTWPLILLLTIPYLAFRALVWYELLKALGIEVPRRHLILAFAGGEMTKSLPAGIFVENYILGRVEHLNRVETVRSTMATTAMLGLEAAIAVPIVVILGIPGAPWLRWTIIGIVAAWLCILVGLRVLISEAAQRFNWRTAKWLRTAAQSIQQFLDAAADLLQPRVAVNLLPTFAYMVIYVLFLYVILRAVGIHHFSFVQAVAVYGVVVLAVILIPIPTEIGITEFTGLSALEAFGIPHATAAIAILSLRLLATGATIIVSLVVFLYVRYWLRDQAKSREGVESEASA